MIVQRGLLSKVIKQQVNGAGGVLGRLLSAAEAAETAAGPSRQLALLPAEKRVHAAAKQAAQGLVLQIVVGWGGGLLGRGVETRRRGAGAIQRLRVVPVRLRRRNL